MSGDERSNGRAIFRVNFFYLKECLSFLVFAGIQVFMEYHCSFGFIIHAHLVHEIRNLFSKIDGGRVLISHQNKVFL